MNRKDMKMFSFISRFCKEFRSEQSGSLSVEAVFAFPMLLWAATGTYTFFDAYKAQNATYRANYTISDMLSRETNSIDYNYISGLYKVYRYMTNADAEDSWIRVSELVCVSDCADEANRVLAFDWSRGVNGARDLTDQDFAFYADKIPLLAQGDRLVLIETSLRYKPPFANALVSFPARDLVSHVVTRPRFAPQIVWDPSYDPSDGGTHADGSEDTST
jgi:hypothetical protein